MTVKQQYLRSLNENIIIEFNKAKSFCLVNCCFENEQIVPSIEGRHNLNSNIQKTDELFTIVRIKRIGLKSVRFFISKATLRNTSKVV